MVISQGDVCRAELPEPTGSGPGFRRPVVVVQGGCLESKPGGHGGLRAAHKQSAVGGRAGQRAADGVDDGPAERLGRERVTGRRP